MIKPFHLSVRKGKPILINKFYVIYDVYLNTLFITRLRPGAIKNKKQRAGLKDFEKFLNYIRLAHNQSFIPFRFRIPYFEF